MFLTIELEDASVKDFDTMYQKVGEPIHDSLSGNQDYIDSNIVLNVDQIKDNSPTCYLYFSKDDCKDIEYIREKAKQAIDIFIDNLKENS